MKISKNTDFKNGKNIRMVHILKIFDTQKN